MKWLIFGGNGWIGKQLCKLLHDEKETVFCTEVRADNEVDVENEINKIQPDRIVSLIGRTYGPGINSIDYLENKLFENINDNLYSPMVLSILCMKHNIHFTYLGTGCIFTGSKQSKNTVDGSGFEETDKPNFFGSSYSIVKGFTDRLMHFFEENTLNLRIRMPINGEHHPRNFITKMMSYKKICSIPNSMSVLPELLPIMIDMSKRKIVGTFNFTNPGLISHNEILNLIKEHIDPEIKWDNITIEEQRKMLASDRSNNKLRVEKLQSLYPNIKNIGESVKDIIMQMKKINLNDK